jgi:hypothetical protein
VGWRSHAGRAPPPSPIAPCFLLTPHTLLAERLWGCCHLGGACHGPLSDDGAWRARVGARLKRAASALALGPARRPAKLLLGARRALMAQRRRINQLPYLFPGFGMITIVMVLVIVNRLIIYELIHGDSRWVLRHALSGTRLPGQACLFVTSPYGMTFFSSQHRA